MVKLPKVGRAIMRPKEGLFKVVRDHAFALESSEMISIWLRVCDSCWKLDGEGYAGMGM
jgi:hypothetical protein